MIYFLTLQLAETVHAIGLGFTDVVYKHAQADTAEAAEALGHRYCEGKHIRVKRVQASPARQQNLARYAFPEDVLGVNPAQA